MNIKKRRHHVMLVLLLIIWIILMFLIFRKKDYTIKYEKDGYQIEETYNKDQEYYSFIIKKENEEYQTIIENKFMKKKIITKIDTYEEELETCIKISSNKIRFIPLCKNKEEQISHHLVNDKMKEHLKEYYKIANEQEETYNNLTIYNHLFQDYYIWNYQGFNHINKETKENIKLFEKDIYEPKLLTKVEEYLFIPDYNENYFFKKVTLLNTKTKKQETWELENPIYFDSTILGVQDSSIYLVDKHEKIEWKITPKKKKIEKIGTESKGGKTWNETWVDVSMNKLINQENTFKKTKIIEYKIENGVYQTFLQHQIKIKEKKPDKLIESKENMVFYLDKDVLYVYENDYGEVKLLKNFEWNFNSSNVIFIF